MDMYQTPSAEQRFEITRVVDRRLRELGISGLRDALQEQTRHFGHALTRLTEAQARTEVALKHQRRHLSGLGDVIGFGLEDIAKTVVPGYLQRHFGIDLEGPLGDELARRFFDVNGQPVEVDLYGEGTRDGRRVVVLAESKSRIGGAEVRRFARSPR